MHLDGSWNARQLKIDQTDSGGKLGVSFDDITVRPDYLSVILGQPSVKEFGVRGLGLRAEMVLGETNLPPVNLAWPKSGLDWTRINVLSSTNLQGTAFGFQVDVSLNITNTLAIKNLIQDNTDKPDLIRPSLSEDSKLLKSEMVARKLKPVSYTHLTLPTILLV